MLTKNQLVDPLDFDLQSNREELGGVRELVVRDHVVEAAAADQPDLLDLLRLLALLELLAFYKLGG